MIAKSIALVRRYFMSTVVNFLILYIFFALLFFGGQFIAKDLITKLTGPLIVAYFLFTMALAAYADLTHALTEEAQWGTLEQLTISPIGFTQIIIIIKTGVNFVGTFVTGVIFLALMLLTTGSSLSIAPIALVILGFLTLMPVVGIGFAFGGAALVYKQIETVFPVVQLSFIGLVILPVQKYAFLKILPIALGSHLLQRVMTNGLRLWDLPAFDLGILIGKAIVYIVIGLLIFRYTAEKSRSRGVLGHY